MRFKQRSLYLLLISFSLSALAESAQPVKVTTFAFPPFIVSDSDALLSGSAIDAAKQLFDKANLKPLSLAYLNQQPQSYRQFYAISRPPLTVAMDDFLLPSPF